MTPDILKTLTDEELAKVKPLTKEQIDEALRKGREEAEAAWAIRNIQIPNTGRRYR